MCMRVWPQLQMVIAAISLNLGLFVAYLHVHTEVDFADWGYRGKYCEGESILNRK